MPQRLFTAIGLFAVLLLFVFIGAGPARAGLITNGGFETGDFTGWTLGGVSGFRSVTTGAAHSGTYGGSFGEVGGDGWIEQSFTSSPGGMYQVGFWLWSPGGTPNDFSAVFDTTTEVSLTNAPTFDWTNYTYTAQASGTTATVRFNFRQDPSYWRFDDVSVTAAAVPEPATFALLGLALCALPFVRRRRS